MKTTILFLLVLAFTSCKDASEDSLAFGAWHHIESMNDIGDGNPKFQKTESDKTLLFTAYGTVISNKSVCMGNNHKDETIATWNVDQNTFNVEDCVASYEVDEDEQVLIVSYQCIETCKEKYERAK